MKEKKKTGKTKRETKVEETASSTEKKKRDLMIIEEQS